MFISIIGIILGLGMVYVMFLFFYQRRLIYFPRDYEPSELMAVPQNSIELTFQTSSGHQTAFYIHPERKDPKAPPDRLWVLFPGNASLALDWLELIESIPDRDAGFLLIDYPGYGKCQGKPSAKSIIESSESAFKALCEFLGTEVTRLETNLNVLGASLGTATGLAFAVRHPVRRIILVAPFTSLLDMARLSVGSPLCHLLIDRFDNRARLAELAQRPYPPEVHIFHGDADNITPLRMGQELAQLFPSMVTFHLVQGADHYSIFDMAKEQIIEVMTAPYINGG